MAAKSTSAILLELVRPLARVTGAFLALLSGFAVWRYPYQSDPPLPEQQRAVSRSYYETVYAAPEPAGAPEDQTVVRDDYARLAKEAARSEHIEEMVKGFLTRNTLERAKVLEIGAGRGHLQDLVDDYTGLDIAASSRRFFHKKFVQASATAMPFPDGAFDAAFSIRVFEHVPNPEHALIEARRVVRDGGPLLLLPSFDCAEWLADGVQVRPYSDFNWKGKAYKAALPVIQAGIGFSTPLVRLARQAEWTLRPGPTRYRYRLLEPNYKNYWQGDSDALNLLDYFETAAWFTSRGDECLNCPWFGERLTTARAPLILRVHKRGGGSKAVAAARP